MSQRQVLGNAPQATWQVAFLERVDLDQLPALGRCIDQVSGEKVHGETAMVIDVVATRSPGTVVSITPDL